MMFSQLISGLGCQIEYGLSLCQSQPTCSTIAKTDHIAHRHLSAANHRASSTNTFRSFSSLRLVFWAALLWGARGQSVEPFPATMELSSLNGINGFVLNGEAASDGSGVSVSSAGDVNGDRIDDLLIGAYRAAPSGKSQAGKSYVIFGKIGLGSLGSIELSSLTRTNGFGLNGEEAGDLSGRSVSSAGDINGDGIDDLIIGAYSATHSGKLRAGKSYVIFGKNGLGSSGIIELSSLTGTNGFVLNGEAKDDRNGISVSSAGDVNGDGIDDLIIGAFYATPSGESQAGKSYVIFGKKGLGASGSIELSSLTGTNGFVLNGAAASDQSGRSVSSAGDVNGDGIDDLIIGAADADPSGKSSAGKSYVIFGKRGLGSSGSIELSSLTGTNGFVLNGEVAGDLSGISVSSAGDVNGDGINDLLIGAFRATPSGKSEAGKSYVIFGKKALGSSGSIKLSSLTGTDGFVLNGAAADDFSGYSVSSAGDVNGDGIDDLIIGAYSAAPSGKSRAGKSYVIFGKKGLGSSGSIELSSLTGTTGFVLNGEAAGDQSGHSVSSAGDVNGDRIDDLLIGSYLAAPSGKLRAGKSYLIFGRNLNPSISTSSNVPTMTSSLPQISMQTISLSSALIADQEPTSASSTPFIVWVALAVAAVACSLFGGVLFYFKSRSSSNDKVKGTALSPAQPDPKVPAGFVDISSLQPEMQSARVEGDNAILSVAKQDGHYAQFPSKQVPHGTGHYHKGGLDKLNQKMDEYLSTNHQRGDQYAQMPSGSATKGTDHYHKGGLDKLNEKMDEYLSTKDVV